MKGRGMISHVCNGGYKGRFCNCGEYGEPIHVEGRPTSLDGRETYHEVFQRNFGSQIMHRGKDITLRGFCYTDWVEIANDWRSTTGYMLLVGVGGILWKCKKQPTIALSTTEVEYTTTSHCTKLEVWLRQLLVKVRYMQEGPTCITCDNQGCIALAKNPTHHYCTKHIDALHHFIRETRKPRDVFELLSNEGYDNGHTCQTICRG